MTPGTDPVVHAIVLNWNGWPFTERCLHSLDGLADPKPRVLVVDNGSTDGSDRRIREAFPDVPVLRADTNLGFAGGMNLGIRRALQEGAAFVWLLNNDTEVEPLALQGLLREAGNERVGIVGSVLRSAWDHDEIQAWGGGSIGRWLGLTELWTSPRTTPPDYVTGASMLLRRRMLEGIGLLDERYFLYFEDADLSLRAAAAGWRLAVAGASVVYHHGGASTRTTDGALPVQADERLVRASGRFLGKHAGWRLLVAVPVRLGGMMRRRLLDRRAARIPVLSRAFIQGVASGLRDRSRPSRPPR
ncbi:MAG: glycosyltransferase family 2 protein [Actinomycetota bacterium]